MKQKTIKECNKTIKELTVKMKELEYIAFDEIKNKKQYNGPDAIQLDKRYWEITNLRHMINENKNLIAWHNHMKNFQ